MLGNQPFYFETTTQILNAFGFLFSNITIVRPVNNQQILVPITQCEKEKFYVDVVADPNQGQVPGQRPVSLQLPRMGYELTGWRYDPSRKLSTLNYRVAAGNTEGMVQKQLNPVPMIFELSLFVATRTLTDGWMIAEQILPFFTPDLNISINEVPELNITRSIPFTLIGSSRNDRYESSFGEKRAIIWEYNFTAKGHMYPPVNTKPIILQSNLSVGGLLPGDAGYVESIFRVNPPDAQINQPFTVDVCNLDGQMAFDWNLNLYDDV